MITLFRYFIMSGEYITTNSDVVDEPLDSAVSTLTIIDAKNTPHNNKDTPFLINQQILLSCIRVHGSARSAANTNAYHHDGVVACTADA